MQNATQRKATLDTLLAVLETKRAQREEAQRQTRKDNEDKKPGASAASIDKIKGAFDGLMANPTATTEQTGLPKDRRAAFLDVAESLIDDGVNTPEGLAAALMAARPDGSLRKYSQALWNFFGTIDPSLTGQHDWNAVLAGIDQAEAQEPVSPDAKISQEAKSDEVSSRPPSVEGVMGPSSEQGAAPASAETLIMGMPWRQIEAMQQGEKPPFLQKPSAEKIVGKIVSDIAKFKIPVSKEALETYRITLPKGYILQGDFYVFQPAEAPASALGGLTRRSEIFSKR